MSSCLLLLFPHPAWPLVDGALLVSKRRSPAPDDLLTFVRPLCRPVGDPKPRGLQGSTGSAFYYAHNIPDACVLACISHPLMPGVTAACRSTRGLMPSAHLADGRLVLVLVRKCSRLQYFRFLLRLSHTGVWPGMLPYVDVLHVTSTQVGS